MKTVPIHLPWSLVMLGAMLLPAARAQAPAPAPAAPIPLHREAIEWSDAWYANADKSDKPAVLIIGDSISKGYGGVVEQGLAGNAYMARLSTSRGVCDPCLLDELRAMVRNHRFAVVHFNNGLHGIAYTAAEYEAGYRKVLEVLLTEGQGAKLVLAGSTFVLPGFKGWMDDAANRTLIDSRNAIVKRLAAEAKLPFNDLCAVTDGHPEYYNSSDKIHFNATGYAQLGAKVAAAIQDALRKQPD
jgi:lysophospholipase L1-like esterase